MSGQGRAVVKSSTLDATDFCVPGFIDTHIHAPQYPNAGTGLDLPLMQWLDQYTFPSETAMADASLRNGAVGVRLESPEHIGAVRRRCPDALIIGLWKCTFPDSSVYITPGWRETQTVWSAGADVIAIDATARPRPERQELEDLMQMLELLMQELQMLELLMLEQLMRMQELLMQELLILELQMQEQLMLELLMRMQELLILEQLMQILGLQMGVRKETPEIRRQQPPQPPPQQFITSRIM